MLLRHATTKYVADLIKATGLKTECAVGETKAVWLHSLTHAYWATAHTAYRHNCDEEDVVVFVVNVPRSWLVRFRSGLWKCMRDIPADRIELAEVTPE